MRTKLWEKRTVSLAYAGLKSDHMHRYEQSKYLANSLKSDVVDEIAEFNKKQVNELKNIFTTFKKLEKNLKHIYNRTEEVSPNIVKFLKNKFLLA